MRKRALLAAVAMLMGASSLALSQEDHSHHGHSTQPDDPHAAHGHAPAQIDEPTQSEREHVPPDPPTQFMGDMSNDRMIELMQMDDNAAHGMVLLDQLERREMDHANATTWEVQGWYGTDYQKVWVESEGERVRGEEEGRVELLWDRIIARWWSVQAGVRQDFGPGPSRTWGSVGVQGLAPYFFDVDAALYLGEGGRTAARFNAEYDLLITQRLILQPELEFDLYGKDDARNDIASGLSNVELGLRLRYELRRELAPYIGLNWERKLGGTADLARDAGDDASDLSFVAGVRAWF